MIARNFIEEWRTQVQWRLLPMVEQDLVISRALISLYNNPAIKGSLVFRGGTALNKLFIKPASRYSEDLDFVQRKAEPIGATIDIIRKLLKPWLGEPKRKLTERSAKLVYKYQSIDNIPAKLKIEINTTEHLQILPLKLQDYSITSSWFSGTTQIVTYQIEELMATKLKALYQRRKGRDLFDLWYASKQNMIDIEEMLDIFKKYCLHEGVLISRKMFEENLEIKYLNSDFRSDMNLLLPYQIDWNFDEAFHYVVNNIINQLS